MAPFFPLLNRGQRFRLDSKVREITIDQLTVRIRSLREVPMPTLPRARVTTLSAANLGSLLTVRGPDRQVVVGLRVEIPTGAQTPSEPALVQLSPLEHGGFNARVIPTRSSTSWLVNQNTLVLNHGDDWSIRVAVSAWDSDVSFRNFAADQAGLLLLASGGEPGMAVGVSAGCDYLSLADWSVCKPAPGRNYATARIWNVLLSGPVCDLEWLFGRRL